MLAQVTSATPWGIEARAVQVEVDVRAGLPQTHIVGLPDAAVRESRERVVTAIRNCGFDLAPRVVTVNLAPADLPKSGNNLDLAIALGLLSAHGYLLGDRLRGLVVCGELGLDGSVRPIRGALPIAELAAGLEARHLLLPGSCAAEAAALREVPVVPIESLADAIQHLRGETLIQVLADSGDEEGPISPGPDLADVQGQEAAKRALEIAAAGGHNLLLTGPPGSGKTMLARRLPGILPPLTRRESIEVTKIHSTAALHPPSGLVRARPFRSPHAGVSSPALVGGGQIPRPGEVTLAHHGVLFLDEFPEFRRDALESLRQPLEDGCISVVRAKARFTFPARFTLVAAMNPCKCSFLGDPRHECRCSQSELQRYRGRLSGPLLDRIDLHVEVPALKLEEFKGKGGEATEVVRERVKAARLRQRARGSDAHTNASMNTKSVRETIQLDASAQGLLDAAFERLGLSARAATRVLKVARTIADLESAQKVGASHVAEAIQYRSLLKSKT